MALPPTAYAQQLLRQGYSAQVIRAQLLRAGYGPYDADQAIRLALRASPQAGIPWAWIGAGIGGLALITFIILLLLPTEASLQMAVQAPQATIPPGGSAQATITLESDGRPAVTLTYALLSSGGTLLWSEREDVSVDRSASLRKTIPIPSNAPPGRYSIRVTAMHGGPPVSKTAPLVIERAGTAPAGPLRNETLPGPITPPAPAASSCPAKCDDFYACTSDACVDGRCAYTPIVPCCGNYACEAGETSITCQEDCRPQAASGTTATTDDALIAAARSHEEAVQLCRAIPIQERQDECFDAIAAAASRSELCNAIQDRLKRDSCYMEFAIKDDFTVCDKIEDRYLASSCIFLSKQG